MLYDIVLKKKQDTSGITCNPIMDAFDLNLCKVLDNLAINDRFVYNRLEKVSKELQLTSGIDYNAHYNSAFDAYNETVIYYLLQQKGFDIKNVPEEKRPTPDFEVIFKSRNWEGKVDIKSIFIEVKSLSFADGNLQYKKVQQYSLDANIKIEEQRKCGRSICFGEYEVSPLGEKDKGITTEIEILINKINQNIKEAQYNYKDGRETILLVDLSQYIFSRDISDCLPIYPDSKKKCCISGLLWMVAFGCYGERIYSCCEFEGKHNFDRNLERQGILISHSFIKGIIFCSGAEYNKKNFYGFYRHNEEDSDSALFICQACDFANDDQNSNGFKFFENEF